MTNNKLWQTDSSQQLNPLVENYTKGKDQSLDQKLLGYDIQASKAHAQMLCSIGILTENELKQIEDAFDTVHAEWTNGQFKIQNHQEDGHSALEEYLVSVLGDTGKKIHTGRSRNDQSLVMMRLYMKDTLDSITKKNELVVTALSALAKEHAATAMPGYTHMQKAMPTTVGTWLNSYLEAFKDMQSIIDNARTIIDQNPLGSAAGFGVSINLNRELTTTALGFHKTQNNPMYCGLSRGMFEVIATQSLSPTMILLGKFAQDMLLFTTEEFGFFSLPSSFTTGSSIMPQKRNYDVFEIMRGHAHSYNGYIAQLQGIYGSIGGGYQRDLQLTKGIVIEAFEIVESTLEILATIIPEIKVHAAVLEEAITDDMKSVEKINHLVNQGVPFRDAYLQIKNEL